MKCTRGTMSAGRVVSVHNHAFALLGYHLCIGVT